MLLLSSLPILLFTLLPIILAVVFLVWFGKNWNKTSKMRKKNAEEHKWRNGGQTVLEWNYAKPEEPRDYEYGEMLVRIYGERNTVCFYEKGMTIGQSRISYEDLEDVYVLREGSRTGTKARQEADKSSTGLFLKLKNKQKFCINQSNYSIDIRVANMIRKGLGYCTDEEAYGPGVQL